MTPDPTTDALIVLGAVVIAMLTLSTLAGGLRLLERRFPRFSRWLDRHVGEPQPWERPW